MSSTDDFFKGYKTKITDAEVKEAVAKIITTKTAENKTKAVYKTIFNCIDLTSLNHTDSEESIKKMIQKVNDFNKKYIDIAPIAAICVYPSMINTVKENLNIPVPIAAVSGGFPSSQTFIEIKIAETGLCVLEGATEIDTVISVGKFLSGNLETVKEELIETKAACKNAHLKVILETGSLQTSENIKKAAILAMRCGADFIKTSTGKTEPAATLEAAYVMCETIKEFHTKTGEKVGFKAAGGIVTTEDAVNYYTIVKNILGNDWLNNQLFRIGASRLANNLLTAITDKNENYF
ncbi:MAG: deoxyribose-phosphate aldolase [Paludibacteraceae bacterium]|nr:deoxyribose-phosphate aldolase [Paludibacteraceae bacterium]MBN2787035.1 deoxyribose-phosphate aldolase [Paludibacteraceae bacterium]